VNNLPKVVTQQRRGRASNPRLLDRKSDALPLSHRATVNSKAEDHTTFKLKREITRVRNNQQKNFEVKTSLGTER